MSVNPFEAMLESESALHRLLSCWEHYEDARLDLESAMKQVEELLDNDDLNLPIVVGEYVIDRNAPPKSSLRIRQGQVYRERGAR